MDDASVALSLGQVEGWIEKVGNIYPDVETSVVLGHLKVVENALLELRRNRNTVKEIIRTVKGQIDAANVL